MSPAKKNELPSRIKTRHPEKNKVGVNIDRGKYEIVAASMKRILRNKTNLNHTSLLHGIKGDLLNRQVSFEGSLSWYVEVVKLDIEARSIIRRDIARKPHSYSLKKKA